MIVKNAARQIRRNLFTGDRAVAAAAIPRLDGAIASFDLISDALPFGRLWYDGPEAAANATGYAKFYSRSHHAVIRVSDEAGNLIEAHKHAGDFRES
jgi:hypothetical protein